MLKLKKGSHYFDLVLMTENSVNKNSTPSKNESYFSLLFQYFVCKFSHSTDMNGSEWPWGFSISGLYLKSLWMKHACLYNGSPYFYQTRCQHSDSWGNRPFLWLVTPKLWTCMHVHHLIALSRHCCTLSVGDIEMSQYIHFTNPIVLQARSL